MPAPAPPSFVDTLAATLTLKIGTQSFEVLAGDIKKLELDIHPSGLSGSATFWFVAVAAQSEDTLFSSFVDHDLVEVTLELARHLDETYEEASSMTVKGIVTEKSVLERAFEEVDGQPVLQRQYMIRFADRATVLWGQHRPTAIYVDKSIKDLIEANKPADLTMKYPWTDATTSLPVLALGLGGKGNDASFLDFMVWLCHTQNLGFCYDSAADEYSLVSQKPTGNLAKTLWQAQIASVSARFPEIRRDAGTVLNSYTDASVKKKDLTNDDGVNGVRTDHLMRSSVASDADTRATLEGKRMTQREPEAVVYHKIFPTTPLVPPMKASFDAAFGSNIYQSGKTYRVQRTRISAEAVSQEPTDDNGEESNAYRIVHETILELTSDAAFRYPPFKRPVYPFSVEGKVLSETGDDTLGTYQIYQDSASRDVYRVKVPLFDDIQVIAPFEPSYQTGHFYFPAIRDQRVLLEMSFDRARIRQFLDFRTGARLSADTQGNHLLLGKAEKNQTSIRHVYEEDKPKLIIERTMDKDLQVITISEGSIKLTTQETE